MAQSKKSEGLCHRIHSAISPFRSRTRRISHQPQGPVSLKNPVEITSEPVHVRRQFSMSETVPVEFGHAADEREILIVRGQKLRKSSWTREEKAETQHAHSEKVKDEDHHHEGRFSEYISKFKNRMIKTASNSGYDGGGGGNSVRRDSFNDKVTSYIDQARVKIRTTTNVGIEDQNLIKKSEN